MSFVRVKDLLEMGKKNNACVLAFDAADGNMIKSVIKGAEAAGKPVMVMLYPGMRNIMPFGVFAETTKYYAERASVPVGLHLDHCSDFDMIMEAIHEGFSSVMADGSVLSFEENVAFTRKVVEVARNFDVDVEGELGHGLYKSTPKLDIDHLKVLSAATDTPLVLHGGTGIPDDQLALAFANGINKINIGTEFFNLNTKLNQEFYAQDFTKCDPFGFPEYIQPKLTEYIAGRLELSKITL